MAIEERDDDLVALDASHLFEYSTTSIGFRRETYMRSYMYDFIEMFSPHLSPEKVAEAIRLQGKPAAEKLFADVDIPII